MKRKWSWVLFALAGARIVLAQQGAPAAGKEFVLPVPPISNDYLLGEDSKPHANVPHGSTFQFVMDHSKVYPGTVRTISVYVPAQYAEGKPACVYVGLDGLGYNAPVVFDNLMARGEMPVTVTIGVNPGAVASADGKKDPRYDRSLEFDSRTDQLANFLIEEVLPAVEAHRLADGRNLRLSKDPNDRSIGGGSTGAIAAFNVAWQRPDAFRRVFSSIGTYVGMRGGEQEYVEVRKTEPKPIRIFMQDGAHDEWMGGPEMGDWWMSNLTMERALSFAGYDVRHTWGDGDHNGAQAAALFPDAMRWLWRGYPAAIEAGAPGNPALKAILKPSSDWQVVAKDCSGEVYLGADRTGRVFFDGNLRSPVAAVDEGRCAAASDAGPIAFGPKGEIYRLRQENGGALTESTAGGKERPILTRQDIRGLAVRSNGDLYVSVANGSGEIWLVTKDGREVRQAEGLKGASGLALSPDQLWLFAAQKDSHLSYSYRVGADGQLTAGTPLYSLSVPADEDDSGAGSVAMDREGRAYVASRMGVQVMDHNGRVIAILPLPNHQAASSLCFGGEDFATLYVYAGHTVYRRQMKIGGLAPGQQTSVPNWGAG